MTVWNRFFCTRSEELNAYLAWLIRSSRISCICAMMQIILRWIPHASRKSHNCIAWSRGGVHAQMVNTAKIRA